MVSEPKFLLSLFAINFVQLPYHSFVYLMQAESILVKIGTLGSDDCRWKY